MNIILLLVFAHLFGWLFFRLHLPRAVGEICGGLVISTVYPIDAQTPLLAALSWIGLTLLMFLSGFEVQKSFDAQDRRVITALLFGSTIVPFAVGWAFPGIWGTQACMGPKNSVTALCIVSGIAMAVTSVPVISRIFMDLGVLQTRFAKIVLTTSTLHDIILWAALAFATFAVEGNNLAKAINVNAMFIAFAVGIGLELALGDNNALRKGKVWLKKVSLVSFIPLYFAIVGLKVDVARHCDPVFLAVFLLCAFAVQAFGTILAARLVNQDLSSSINLAVAMNTRGGPCIVLATVAYDLEIINAMFFTTLVLVAIVTSLGAGYWFKYALHRGKPLM